MQNQKLNIQRIELEVKVGSIIPEAVKPHFKGLLKPYPGFYIYDPNEDIIYTGYLKGLNEADLPENYEKNHEEDFPGYKLIIREILPPTDEDDDSIIYLEERVEKDDAVYVLVNGPKKGNMHGRFLNYQNDKWSYEVLISQTEEDIRVKRGNRVLGLVTSVADTNSSFDLFPIEIVDKPRFKKHKNRIIRAKK